MSILQTRNASRPAHGAVNRYGLGGVGALHLGGEVIGAGHLAHQVVVGEGGLAHGGEAHRLGHIAPAGGHVGDAGAHGARVGVLYG